MMDLSSLLSKLRRSLKIGPDQAPLTLNLQNGEPGKAIPLRRQPAAAETIPVDRPLSEAEHAIAKWLLLHAEPSALSFIPQLDVARVTGGCSCGCPTVDLKVPEGTPREEPLVSPFGNAIGEVEGKMVGIMLFQAGGYLTCLEIHDLSDIEPPYGLPSLESLRPWEAASSSD